MDKNQKTFLDMLDLALRLSRKGFIFDPGLSRTELIRQIQRAEDSFDCYAKAPIGSCQLAGCLWREGCQEQPIESNPCTPAAFRQAIAPPYLPNLARLRRAVA